MQAFIWILGIVVLIGILIFNSLIRTKNAVKNSWAGIDVQLKKRADLIPNLVAVVQGYATHEKTVLKKLTELRSELLATKGNVRKAAKSDEQLSATLKSLFAVAENYPKLRANENFLDLQKQLSKLETQIAAARRIYNENVMYYNTKVEMFPTNIFARLFGFHKELFFETAEKDPVTL
jgi:LemA protein